MKRAFIDGDAASLNIYCYFGMQFIADNNNKITTKLQTVSSDSTHQNGHIHQILNFCVGMKTREIRKRRGRTVKQEGKERGWEKEGEERGGKEGDKGHGKEAR